MDPVTRLLMQGAAGAGGGAGLGIEEIFSTWLYTGNGSTQTITNGIDLAGEGGLVWIKSRASAVSHALFDTARGVGNILSSDTTSASAFNSVYLSAFNSDGFSLNSGGGVINSTITNYASWTFRKAPGFFDVVTYTGTGSAQAISHSLGSAPGFIVAKQTDGISDWIVYHQSRGATKVLTLNSTGAEFTAGHWDSTAPTSTHFYVGGGGVSNNISGATYVAYLFAHDAQIFGEGGDQSVIKCGSFTTGASGNVGTVTLGWEPQYILAKRTDTVQNWYTWDTMRGWDLTNQPWLAPNLSDAESNPTLSYFAPNATGFSGTGNWFGVNANVIYIAIRRGPMKTPTSGTEVFSTLSFTGSTGTSRTVGFPIDLNLQKARTQTYNSFGVSDRLRGLKESSGTGTPQLYTASTAAETTANSASVYEAWNTTRKDGAYNSAVNNIEYNFRRAPGFFDVVAYTGTGAAQTVNHNLSVAPELMIVKSRSIGQWCVYSSSLGIDYRLFLQLTDAASSSSSSFWNATLPTSSVFSVGTNVNVNGSGVNYITYLFSTLPGISKVGSYTGTGTTLNVDCGFTAGARFVLIKRTDSTGGWYVWDTARGIISGNDPYLLLNSTAAEVTSTDYIDPLSSGFQISSTAPAAINASGGSFIFLAVA